MQKTQHSSRPLKNQKTDPNLGARLGTVTNFHRFATEVVTVLDKNRQC